MEPFIISQADLDWSQLNGAEKQRLRYLVWVRDTVDKLNTQFKEFAFDSAWNEGLSVQRRISWQDVQRYCFPALIVVMISDGDKEKQFFEFPGYALIPRLGEVVDLSVTPVPPDEPGRANRETEMSIVHLDSIAQSIGGSKGENAMKHLNILRRMLRVTD